MSRSRTGRPFASAPSVPKTLRLIEFYDYRRRLALVAERGPVDAPEIEAVARYGPTDDPEIAKVAFEDNSRMLDLLNRFTDVRDRHLESGVVTLDFERRAGDEIARHG